MNKHYEFTEQNLRRVVDWKRVTFAAGRLRHAQYATIVHAEENVLFTRHLAQQESGQTTSLAIIEQRSVEVAYAEGCRELATAKRHAVASYAIDWLFDGSFYVAIATENNVGAYSGSRLSREFQSRSECVDFFLAFARSDFESNYPDMSAAQCAARKEMKALLAPDLFGFLEPEPVLS